VSESNTKNELAMSIDEAEWQWLKPHMERGVLIIVTDDLDLAEVGFRIAIDDAQTIEKWINKGFIGKPTLEDATLWDSDPKRRFQMLVLSPYILIIPC